MKIKIVIPLSITLIIALAFPLTASEPKVIGIEIKSKWGAGWRFPVNSIDNAGQRGEGVQNYRHLQEINDGDVLVIGTHSNPRGFGVGTQFVNWEDFWDKFRVDNPPRLGAVVICGCVEGVTEDDLERIRSAFNAGAVFTPRGTYGLPHLISSETIIAGLKDGESLDEIFQKVSGIHFMKAAAGVGKDWNLNKINANIRSFSGSDAGPVSGDYGGTTAYVIWINKFGSGGRIHIGTMSGYKAKKRYRDEWLAGMSEEYLEKELLFGGRSFDKRRVASDFICSQLGNKRRQKVLGWGMLDYGDYGGKTYLIDGLGCKIQ